MKRTTAVSIALLSVSIGAQAWACSGGMEWRVDSGKYTADITDDTPILMPGEPVHFDFGLLNKSDPVYGPLDIVPFSVVKVALTHGSQQIFTKEMPYQADRELTGFDYQLPQRDATYSLVAQYWAKGNEVAASTIPLQVGNGDGASSSLLWIALFLLFGLPVLIVLVLQFQPFKKLFFRNT